MSDSIVHMFRVLALLCAASAVLATPSRADRGGVLFYAGFNGSTTAVSVGSGTPIGSPSSPIYAQGSSLQGITLGGSAGYLTYSAGNNIIQDHGSVEFWFSPLDWSGATKDFVFFKMQDPGWFVLYKRSGDANCYFMLSEDRKYFSTPAMHALSDVQQGQWHHLVATWNREECCLYLDGVASKRVRYPRIRRGDLVDLRIGGDSWLGGTEGRTVIDEFYVYDRPLTDAEVSWAYANSSSRVAGDDVSSGVRSPLFVSLCPLPSKNLLKVEVTASGHDSFSGTASMVPDAGTGPAQITMTGLHQGTATIPITDLRARSYAVNVIATDSQGAEIGRATKTLVSSGSPPVWRGNRIGIPATPPPPWTPVTVDGDCKRGQITVSSISCWGRTYEIGPTGFPMQMKSRDTKLLTAPVELRARVNGSYVKWVPESKTIISHSALEAQMQGVSNSDLGELQWKLTMEFDGMARYDLKLKPKPGVSVDDLQIRFRLNPTLAGLFYTYEPGAAWGATSRGALPSQQGVLRQSNWVAYWWLGNEDLGLAGYCESDEAWARVDSGKGFYFERGATSVDAVWDFVDAPKAMDQEWDFTFALQATPVKATPDWRKWRLAPRFAGLGNDLGDISPQRNTVSILWSSPDLMPYFGYPVAKDKQLYASVVDYVHGLGAKVIPYSIITQLASQSPEWKFFGEEWGNAFYLSGMSDIAAYNEAMLGCDPNPDWIDFCVWANDKYVREMNLDGLYHDNTFLIPSTNRFGGHGYIRDGKIRPTYPVFATREMYRRIYCMLKAYGQETGKEMFMFSHMSTNMIIPFLGFSDAYLDGELLPVIDNYLDVVSLDELRAQYMGRNYGVMPYILPEFKKEWGTKPEQAQHLMGLVLLHDMGIWPIWCNTDAVRDIYRVVDRVGIDDAEFLPYWSNTSVIGGQSNNVKCSAYRKPGGGSLVCIVNTTRQVQTASLTVDWSRLQSSSPAQVLDAVSGNPISVNGSSLVLQIQPLNFRLVEVL